MVRASLVWFSFMKLQLLSETRFYTLQQSEDGLLEGEQFAVLSQQVLEGNHGYNDQDLFTRLISNSYRYQGIRGTHMNDPSAITNCKKCISILVDRIESSRR